MTDETLPRSMATTTPALRTWFRALRPRQWAKNVLVFSAPVAAAALDRRTILVTSATFVGFCLVASAVYLVNDSLDVERDRLHPKKRLRPIAAGQISITAARVVAVLLLVAGFAISSVGGWGVTGLLGLYVVLTLLYSGVLKHQVILDILIVASGFVIRAAIGGVAADVPISSWFLLVTSFGALMVVTGKRYAEFNELSGNGSDHRPSLNAYSVDFLRLLLGVTVGMTIITYCLWAFENTLSGAQHQVMALTIVPFLAALLRYVLLVMNGAGGEPEELFLSDRPLQAAGLVWAMAFGFGVFLG